MTPGADRRSTSSWAVTWLTEPVGPHPACSLTNVVDDLGVHDRPERGPQDPLEVVTARL
jgi:hypothetical protein